MTDTGRALPTHWICTNGTRCDNCGKVLIEHIDQRVCPMPTLEARAEQTAKNLRQAGLVEIAKIIEGLVAELRTLRARAIAAEHHKALSLLGKSSYQEVVEDKLRTELAETQLRAEAAEREVASLREERTSIVHMVQTRLQPAGSPPPGGICELVGWITTHTRKELNTLASLTSALKTLEQEIREIVRDGDGNIQKQTAQRWLDTLAALSGTTGPEK